MSRERSKTVSFQDVFESILNGNDSDVEDLGSDDDIDVDSDYDGNNIDDDDTSADERENDDENDDGDIDDDDIDDDEEENKFRWRKRDITTTPDKVFQPEVDNVEEIKTPVEYFRQFWTDDIIDLVVQQTNLYSTQKTGSSINTTKKETEQLIGMHLRMDIVQLPSYKMYWSQKMRIPAIADRMPLKRYEKLRANLHFVDNSIMEENASKLAKIQPVIDIFREQCVKVNPEECHSVDEQIIPAKTKFSGIRQYNPKKPVKWGFKNLVRAGASGIMYDFYVYAGKNVTVEEDVDFTDLQKSAQVVARLCQHLPHHSGHKLFFDNWFTTLDLLIYLKNKGILACGTVRNNRLQGCLLQSTKAMKKAGRGATDYKSDVNSGVIVVKWMDNNAVHVASNYVGVEPFGSVERWSKNKKERAKVPCPQLIAQYNKGMGGVDLADMLIAAYRIPMKTRRWYIKIFWHLIDMAKVNAWLLYRRHCDQLKIPKKPRLHLLDFILEISEALICANKAVSAETSAKPGRPLKRKSNEVQERVSKVGRKPTTPLPCNDSRYDQFGHWPKPSKDSRSRCRYCEDGYSKIYCSKCNICLCLREGKNCFAEYHCK